MTPLRLSLSCGSYDRTLPLLDGRVKAEGIEMVFVPTLRPGSPMGSPEADAYEASITGIIMQSFSHGPHLPLTILPRRKFTHQLLLTRRDSKISGCEDFVGRKIGVLRWYEHPLGVWLRGHLRDRYGISPRQIHWFTDRENLFPISRLEGIQVTLVAAGKGLVQMLVEGEIDILAHEEAQAILLQQPTLRRLFADFKEAEAAYFKESGIFPSYHALAIKRETAARHGWVVANLLKAFEEAKQVALSALERDNSLFSSPWLGSLLEEQYRRLGRDLYPYGLEANRRELETLVRHLHEQGLIPTILSPEEIFAG